MIDGTYCRSFQEAELLLSNLPQKARNRQENKDKHRIIGARDNLCKTLLKNKRGNFMKKVLLVFLALFFVINNNVMANSISKIDELDMSILLPADYTVLTRNIEDSTEVVKALKINKQEFDLMMKAKEAYLIAWEPNRRYEVNVVTEQNNDQLAKTIQDLNLFANGQIEKKMPELIVALRQGGKTPINNFIYTINKAKYIVFDYWIIDEKGSMVYTRNYNTVKNGKMIAISFTRLDGKELTKEDNDSFKSIIDNIAFDDKSIKRAQASTGGTLLVLGVGLIALVGAFVFIVKRLKPTGRN